MNQDNDQLTKLMLELQKNQRWNNVSMSVNMLITLITTLTLVWTAFKKDKLPPAIRLIRLKRRRSAIDLEIAATKEEVDHEMQLVRFGAGLNKFEQEIEDLKEKATNKAQSDASEQISKLKDKIFDPQKK